MSHLTTLDWTIPEDVQILADEQNLAACLPAILEATERIFPTARKRAVVFELDPEVPDLRWIVVEVNAPLSGSDAIAARHEWHDAVRQHCPSDRICSFCLSLRPVE